MHYLFYIFGVVLLCLPGAAIVSRRHRYATVQQISEHRNLWWSWLHAMNLVDLLRGYCAVLLLKASFEAAGGLAGGGLWVTCLIGGVFVIGALLQSFFYRLDERIVVPAAYIAGALCALLPFHVALMAGALGVATAMASRHVGWGLLVSGLGVVAAGVLFRLNRIELGLAALPLFLLLIMQDVMHRRLVLVLLRRSGPGVRFEDRTVDVLR